MPEIAVDFALIDAEAEKLVALAAPIQLRVANNSIEHSCAYRLRFEAIVDRGWMRPEEFPDRMERDHFDDKAIQIVAWDGNMAVGCARVVLPQLGERLPTEEGFDLAVEPKGEVADWGRNVVARSYTGPHYRLFAALLAQSWIETRKYGFRFVCGNATAAVIRMYRVATHVAVETIGPSRIYWGEKRYPFRFDFQQNWDKSKAL